MGHIGLLRSRNKSQRRARFCDIPNMMRLREAAATKVRKGEVAEGEKVSGGGETWNHRKQDIPRVIFHRKSVVQEADIKSSGTSGWYSFSLGMS